MPPLSVSKSLEFRVFHVFHEFIEIIVLDFYLENDNSESVCDTSWRNGVVVERPVRSHVDRLIDYSSPKSIHFCCFLSFEYYAKH